MIYFQWRANLRIAKNTKKPQPFFSMNKTVASANASSLSKINATTSLKTLISLPNHTSLIPKRKINLPSSRILRKKIIQTISLENFSINRISKTKSLSQREKTANVRKKYKSPLNTRKTTERRRKTK